MGFNGYFIKANGIILPNYLLAEDGYKSTPNMRTDKDSYVDGNGTLNRKVLPVKRSKVWIKTRDKLSYSDKLILQNLFPNRDLVTMEYWNDEENAYKTAKFYVPDIEFTVSGLNRYLKPVYKEMEITFIAYGGDS